MKVGLGVGILALIGIIVAIVLASVAVDPVDCVGYWTDCNSKCSRQFVWTTLPSGGGKACPTVAPSCAPGEGACPSAAEVKCQADYKMSCEAANKRCEGNYIVSFKTGGLDIAQLSEQSLEAMSSSTVNNTIFYTDVDRYKKAPYPYGGWTEGSAIQQLWDAYPDKQAWMVNKNYQSDPLNAKFYSGGGNFMYNKIELLTSGLYEGLYLYIHRAEYMNFYYYINGQLAGPQRTFSGDNGYVAELSYEDNAKCGDETHFYVNGTSAINATYPACKLNY